MKELTGKKLLILAGADVHCKIVEAARELGVYTIVTDYLAPEDSPAKLMADEYWMYNITETDAIVDRCRQEGVDGVLSFCIDPAQMPYFEVCSKLGVPCYGTREQFGIMTDKRLFKDYCKRHGVDVVPEYTLDDVEKDNVVYPVLVKPTNSRGSRGQTVCRSKAEIPDAIKTASAESGAGGFIIERYMLGKQDMSFSYIVIDKMPYLLKIGDRYPGSVADNLERQHIATVLPSRRVGEYRENVEPNVVNMIQSLGMSFGAVFLQGFWDDGKVYMYDPGLRFPGGDFDIVLKNATGFDNMKTFVRFALTGDVCSRYGNPVDACLLGGTTCLILSVTARGGKIAHISGLDVLKADERVVSVSQRYKEGETVGNTGDIKQRVLELVAHLPDRECVSDFISFVYDNVRILDEQGEDMIVSRLDTNTKF